MYATRQLQNPRENLDQAFLKRPDNHHPRDLFDSSKQDKWAPDDKAPVVKRTDSLKSESELDKRKPQQSPPGECAPLVKFAEKPGDQWASGERPDVVKRQDNLHMEGQMVKEKVNQEAEDGPGHDCFEDNFRELPDAYAYEDAFGDNFYDLPSLGGSQVTINELTVKLEISEKRCKEFGIKLTEVTKLHQNSVQEAKNCAQDNVKLRNELDCAKKDKSKLENDLTSFKADNDALNKSRHEVEMEFTVKLGKMTKLYQNSEKAHAQYNVNLRNELDHIKMDNESVKKDKSKLEDYLMSFKAKNDALMYKYSKDHAREIDKLGTKLDHAKMENEGLKSDMAELKAKNDALKKKLHKVDMEKRKPQTLVVEEVKNDVGHQSKMVLMARQVSDKLDELPPDNIKRMSLQTLNGCKRVDDEVINMYLDLVTKRSSKDLHLPKVFATNALFYRRFKEMGYKRAANCLPKKFDIFEHELVFIPIHTGEGDNRHWSLVVIDFKKKGIFYYNSINRGGMDIIFCIIDFLKAEHFAKKKKQFEFEDFKFENMTDIPKQKNLFDCGVFVMKYAEFLSRGAPLTFTQENMQYYRKHIKVELFYNQFM